MTRAIQKTVADESVSGPDIPTRREALGTVAMGATGAMMFPHLVEGQHVNSPPIPLMFRLSCEQWSQFVGKSFSVINDRDGTVSMLKLEEVVNDRFADDDRPSHVRQESVSLVFSASRFIADAHYQVRHSKLGSASMYLHATKRGPDASQTRFQTVLN